ncbi:hypothetical protein M6D81_17620 [Paenibacillus sp. J5C_2022]|uniref:hypothetical protein n=1 Tax=Paenibacillus sp. J5C2022 TaxID=2977129 RepID=UPI0021CF6355|nr:hypothetical protein [Paenibacillus sp. J5C2022]MCU6710514.1 hypothetical protein [Paenibacillus sp. J5C2022]
MTLSSDAHQGDDIHQQFQSTMNKAKYMIPFYVLVPLLFWLVFHYGASWNAYLQAHFISAVPCSSRNPHG